jgi:cytochrome c peroxidase
MTDHGSVNDRSITGLKRRPWWVVAGLSLIWALGIGWRAGQAAQPLAPSPPVAAPEVQEPLAPLPLTVAVDPARVALGRQLFQDVRLSGANTIACTTCHQLARGGADGLPQALSLRRNTPTIFNVAFNFAYHWDGVVPTLEAQAEWVLLNPAVMHTTWPALLAKLRADPGYAAAFQAAYPSGLTPANVSDALAAYERSLITPNARFDQYLRGQRQALTAAEQQGYRLFKAYGCVACHQGMNIGGNLFQKFGIFPGKVGPTPPDADADPGRFRVTGIARDRGVFRVPSLRNVAVTAPYFHDGRALTLEGAVDTMARMQLGRTLTPEEVGLIVQFLHTLTGEYQGRSLADVAEAAW